MSRIALATLCIALLCSPAFAAEKDPTYIAPEQAAKDPDFALYGPDNFHPSPLGTYLAALTVYSGLTGRSPVGNTATVPGVTLDERDRRKIQLAAWEAADGLPRRCE